MEFSTNWPCNQEYYFWSLCTGRLHMKISSFKVIMTTL